MKLIEKNRGSLSKIISILLQIIIIHFIIYYSGGTMEVWPQLNVVPIFLAAYFWDIKGSLIVALILGIFTGPFMPLNVYLGINQKPENWIFRTLIYLAVASITGYIFQKNKKMSKQMAEKDMISFFTGLYNTNKLFKDLNKKINNGEKFFLVFLNVRNLEEISKYVSYDIVNKLIQSGIADLKENFKAIDLYSANFNEYVLVFEECDELYIIRTMSNYLKEVSNKIKIGGISFNLIIKIGVVFNSNNGVDATEIFNKAKIAADQGEIYSSGVYVYDEIFDKKKRLTYEIAGSLENAINNDELYIVYQPVIDINKNIVASAEVLLRWQRGDQENVGPNIFIDIAEKIGLIDQISKIVMEKNIAQIIEWENKGIKIKTSVNLTSVEILDESLLEWARKIIVEKGIDKSRLGIEITERIFSNQGDRLRAILHNLRAKGYSISIDDFGTGYNSLISVGEMSFDIIKLDKYFIEHINMIEIKMLIKYIIMYVHELGGTIIAEGVETKEQYEVLKELRCDMIQGYLFSKPLLPDDFADYYLKFDMSEIN